MSDRADALQAMVDSEGWRLFKAHVVAEWAPARCWVRVKEADGDLAKIDYTNVQVGQLMDWPLLEITREKRAEQTKEPTLSRRGGL